MKKRVPKLRFPEFSGEWEEKKLGEVTKTIAGGTPSTKHPEYWERGAIPWMSSGEVNKKIIYSVDKKISQSGYENSSAKMLPENTVVVALAGQGKTRGTVAITKIALCTNQSLAGILCSKRYLSNFVFYNLDNRYNELRLLSSGEGGRGGLNLKIIDDIMIVFPSVPEQQKIADFLSTVDNIIASEQHILDDLLLKKKGLMQKLFSRELRFKDKDGKEFPEWEEKRLGAVADILSGKRIPVGDTFAKDDTGLKYITVSDMDEKYVNSENIQFISSRVESKIKKYKVKTGDIIIAIVGATIGKLNMIPSSLNNANLTENCDKFTNYKSVIPEFLYSLLKSDLVKKEIDSQKTVSAQPKLALDRLRNFIFLFPSIPEQQKIATCLSLLDNVIEEQHKIVAGWKLRKKGLLQQMFV